MKTTIKFLIVILLSGGLIFLGGCPTSESYHTLKVTVSPANAVGFIAPDPSEVDISQLSTLPTWEAEYADGTVVSLTGKGLNGWIFDHWEGDMSGSKNPMNIKIDDDKTVTAVFTYDLGDIVGIWENDTYNFDNSCWAKLDWHSSGNFSAYYNTTDLVKTCEFFGQYWKKWVDQSNAVYYKVEVSSPYFGNEFWYLLVKISDNGNRMDQQIGLPSIPEFPAEIDDQNPLYRTYTKQ
jgi:hypothetical protein